MIQKSVTLFVALLLSVVAVENYGFAAGKEDNTFMTFSITQGRGPAKQLPVQVPEGFTQVSSDDEIYYFVPEGESLYNWTKLFTVSFIDSNQPGECVRKIKNSFDTDHGKFVEQSVFHQPRRNPHGLTQYSYDGPTNDYYGEVIPNMSEMMRLQALRVDIGVVMISYSERYETGSMNRKQKEVFARELWNVVNLSGIQN